MVHKKTAHSTPHECKWYTTRLQRIHHKTAKSTPQDCEEYKTAKSTPQDQDCKEYTRWLQWLHHRTAKSTPQDQDCKEYTRWLQWLHHRTAKSTPQDCKEYTTRLQRVHHKIPAKGTPQAHSHMIRNNTSSASHRASAAATNLIFKGRWGGAQVFERFTELLFSSSLPPPPPPPHPLSRVCPTAVTYSMPAILCIIKETWRRLLTDHNNIKPRNLFLDDRKQSVAVSCRRQSLRRASSARSDWLLASVTPSSLTR